jgi:hypothetical protein
MGCLEEAFEKQVVFNPNCLHMEAHCTPAFCVPEAECKEGKQNAIMCNETGLQRGSDQTGVIGLTPKLERLK